MRNQLRKTLLAAALAVMIVTASAHAVEPGPVIERPGFNLFDLTWRDVREFLMIVVAVIGFVGPTLWWALKSKLAGEFAARAEMQDLTKRVRGVEHELQRLPSEADFKELNNRVGHLEGAVSVANANLDGVKALLDRIDYSVKLLVKHHINGGANE